ncbi:MAG: TatD family hydrolase [Patescibacteria group bacterium]
MLIDAHCHLQFPAFDRDRDETIRRAFKNNIGIINAGANKESSKKAVELARKYPQGLWAAVGLHPTEKEVFDYEFFKKLALDKKVIAIGECGLDYYRIKNNELGIRNLQKEVFIKHIELANELKKSLMIHCRDAFDDLIEILKTRLHYDRAMDEKLAPGVLHFFTGSLDDAKKLLAIGFYFTFGGLITFNRSFDEIIKFIPLERILLETDAPYVAPEPYRGKRNEPLYVIEIAKKMAEIKNVSFNEVARQTTENALNLFKIAG